MDEKRIILQHFLAALAYRMQKALRGAPDEFFDFRAAPGVRTPHQLVLHMTSVLGYARTFLFGGKWRPEMQKDYRDEIKRFHDIIESLNHHLEEATPFQGTTPEKMLQGPFSDAMTHAGQLAMLRRLFGSPIPPENFIMADIDPGNLGPDQPDPMDADKEWLDAEGKSQI